MTAIACAQEEPDDARAIGLLLNETEQTRSIASTLVPLHRDLLHRLTEPALDPTPYLSTSFTLYDAAAPAQIRRGLNGLPVQGDFLHALIRRLPPGHADVTSIELFPQAGGSHVLVLTRHDSVAPSLVTWVRRDDSWQAVRMTINLSEAAIAAMRTMLAAQR